jgi:enoyl-CoA hydratase
MPDTTLHFENEHDLGVLRLQSPDGTNRLTRAVVSDLTKTLLRLGSLPLPLIVTGNDRFFSAGADLNEIAALTGPGAYESSRMGQQLMQLIDDFRAPVYAAISGYCMGGGLDLALACRHRLASPHAVFGHRGAALGLITGWGGTQRQPRLTGKGCALEIFVAAEMLSAKRAYEIALVDAIADDPVAEAMHRIGGGLR